VRADLERLDLSEASFDLAYSSLTFHYIEDLARLLVTVHRALVLGGGLVFSIEHPIYMAPAHPDWLTDAEGRKTWPVNGYQSKALARRIGSPRASSSNTAPSERFSIS
jgi:ubiquinone/menaquinone biosynthesis C-methylase UbiE